MGGFIEQDADRFDLLGVFADETFEERQVILGLVFDAAVADQPRRRDVVDIFDRPQEEAFLAFVMDQQLLELCIAQQGHRRGEVLTQLRLQAAGVVRQVTLGDPEGFEILAGVTGHFFIDSLHPFDQAAGVVIAVAVVPDVIDEFFDRAGRLDGGIGSHRGRVFEEVDQGAVEAVEDGEVGFVGDVFAFAGAAAEHLFEQDPRLDRAEEDDAFDVGDVDAGREEVDGHDDPGEGSVAEFADPLQGSVDPAGDLANKAFAAAEDLDRQFGQFVGVRGVREIIGGEDQGFGEAAVTLFMLVGVFLELLQDLAVGIGGRDLSLDVGRGEFTFVFERIEPFGPRDGVDVFDRFAFAEEEAVDADVGADFYQVPIDEVAVADGFFVGVTEDDFFEIGRGVAGRGRGQPDADGVEMIQHGAPDRLFARRVTAMAFVGDDRVEGVNRDRQLVRVGIELVAVFGKDGLAS